MRAWARKKLPGGGYIPAARAAKDDKFFGAGAIETRDEPAPAEPDEVYKRFVKKVGAGFELTKEALEGPGYLDFADSARKARYICMGILCGEFADLLDLAKRHLNGEAKLDKDQATMLRFLLLKILPDGGRELGFVGRWMKEAGKFLEDGNGKDGDGQIEKVLVGFKKED